MCFSFRRSNFTFVLWAENPATASYDPEITMSIFCDDLSARATNIFLEVLSLSFQHQRQ